MTEAEPIVSSNPPKSSLFPGEFFNNIGQVRTHSGSEWSPDTYGMDAPTLNGIDVPKWKCWLPLK